MSNLNVSKIKFKKKMFNGIDELDVLNKVKSLNSEYQTVLQYKELEYLKMLKSRDEKIAELEAELQVLQEEKAKCQEIRENKLKDIYNKVRLFLKKGTV